jgi:hypothetical protein
MPDPTEYIEVLQRELAEARMVLAAIVAQNGGRLDVHRQYLEERSPNDVLERCTHPETGAIVYRLVKGAGCFFQGSEAS